MLHFGLHDCDNFAGDRTYGALQGLLLLILQRGCPAGAFSVPLRPGEQDRYFVDRTPYHNAEPTRNV